MTRALLAKVHIAKKDLALSDENYRAILVRITGRESSADCSEPQLVALLAEFRRLGWKPKPGKGGSGFDKPHVRKIYALWREAGVVGAIDNASKEALRAFVARQTGKDAPEFCSPSEANKVSEGLKAMIRRAEARR
ncbi:gp16 family protein [Pinisolibacter sp.]|uniref:gp16 family protein n=1 Tax=Pinisolibacter sp. TaxID=2172024 RepID=UPI002FDE75DC